MIRRDLLLGGAALGLWSATAQAGKPAPAPPPAPPAPTPPADPRSAVLATLAACEAAGLACRGHCARELAQGNLEMVECSATVQQMLELVSASRTLIALDAALAKKLVALCEEACRACAAACKKHEPHFAHGMHLECKACLEACEACAPACAAFAAS